MFLRGFFDTVLTVVICCQFSAFLNAAIYNNDLNVKKQFSIAL